MAIAAEPDMSYARACARSLRSVPYCSFVSKQTVNIRYGGNFTASSPARSCLRPAYSARERHPTDNGEFRYSDRCMHALSLSRACDVHMRYVHAGEVWTDVLVASNDVQQAWQQRGEKARVSAGPPEPFWKWTHASDVRGARVAVYQARSPWKRVRTVPSCKYGVLLTSSLKMKYRRWCDYYKINLIYIKYL